MKLPPLNQEYFTQVLAAYSFIQNKAMRIGEIYSKLAKDSLGKYKTFRFPDNWEKMEELTESSFILSYEYNQACHCHPEYTKYEHSFPSSLLTAGNILYEHDDNDHQYDWNEEELTKAIKLFIEQEKQLLFLKQEESNKNLAQLKAKQEKHAQERKAIKEQEKQANELNLLAELQAKYGKNPQTPEKIS